MNKFILKIGHWFFRYRDYTPIPLIILLLVVADYHPVYLGLGILFTVLGESIRIISVAFIGGISRTRKGSVSRLVTDGPFSCVRNPLYIGNFLLSLGLSLLSGQWWFLIIYFFMFIIQYYPIVLWEEDLLIKEFGDEYEDYRKEVRRFIPRFKCRIFEGEFNFKKGLKAERSTLATVISLYILVMVRYFVF